MNISIKSIFIGLLCLLTLLLVDTHAKVNGSGPITNNGKKWRIGYLEGGPYANYQMILKNLVKSMMDSGWIQQALIPECRDESETKTLWNFLSTKIQSDYLEFPSDAYWDSSWDDGKRKISRNNILKRLNNKKNIDLMLAFGTWAGLDLANNLHKTDTMVISASNAILSGIIKSVGDSGYDHVHAWIDPDKTKRQLRLLHKIIGFKRLGLAYENNKIGKSYAGVEDILKLSRELDFQVIECYLPTETGSANESAELIKCHEQLAPKIDSMYITDYAGLTKKAIKKILSPIFKYKVPMFSQTRYDLVKNGILMGTGRFDFKADAEFYLNIFAKILNGAKPRDLPQKFESPLYLVVNLESAKKIGYRIPLDILAGAFEIYEIIENPGNEE